MLINFLTLIIDKSIFQLPPYRLFNLFLNPLVSITLISYFIRKKEGISLMKSILISLTFGLTLLVGSRISYVLVANNYFRDFGVNPFILEPRGLTMFGGFIFTFPMVWFISRLMRIDLWRMLDLITPGWSLGIVFNKTGCLLNGCCYGLPTYSNYGVSYPVGTAPYDNFYNDLVNLVGENGDLAYSLTLHPVQIYEALIGLIGFLISLYLFKKKARDGVVFSAFAMVYSLARFILNFLRATPYPMLKAQGFIIFAYLAVFIVTLLIFLYRMKIIKLKSL